MRKRIFGGATLLAVAGVLAGGGIASAGQAVNGCPADYTLVKASKVHDTATDKNGDGYICTKQIGAPPGTTAFSDIDNNRNQ